MRDVSRELGLGEEETRQRYMEDIHGRVYRARERSLGAVMLHPQGVGSEPER